MNTVITLVTILTALTSIAHAASPDAMPAASASAPRVRPCDNRAASLLLQGLSRSETIRVLVQELEMRDVIVYVEMQPALKKNLAGVLTWVSATPTHRFVRVSLSPELSADTLIATLGHELQHALEIARATSIVDATTLEAYYRAHGVSTRAHVNGWDTLAARVTGDDVRREIVSARVSRVAESIQAFNPDEWQVVYRRARGMLPP